MNIIIQTIQEQLIGIAESIQQFMTPEVVVVIIFSVIAWMALSWIFKFGLTRSLRSGLVEDAPVLQKINNGYLEKTIMVLAGVSIVGFLFNNVEQFTSLLIDEIDGVAISRADGVFNFLKLIMYIGLFRLSYEVSKTIRYMRVWSEENRNQSAIYIQEIVKYVTLIFGSYLVLAAFQLDPIPLIASIGVISIGAGFAVKDTLSNILGFLNVMISKKVKISERVTIAGITGIVVGHTPSEMKILDDNKDIVLIPNHIVNSSIIENHSRWGGANLVVDIPLGHATTMADIKEFEDKFQKEFSLEGYQFKSMGISSMTEKAVILSITGVCSGSAMPATESINQMADTKNAIYLFTVEKMQAAFSSEKVYTLCGECDKIKNKSELCEDCEDDCMYDQDAVDALNYWHKHADIHNETPTYMMPKTEQEYNRVLEKEDQSHDEAPEEDEDSLMVRFLDRVSDVKDDMKEYSMQDLRNDFGDKISSLFGRDDKEKEDGQT